MAPMARYSYAVSQGADGAALAAEFKLLVREAHKRGIEVSHGLLSWCLCFVGMHACEQALEAAGVQVHERGEPTRQSAACLS